MSLNKLWAYTNLESNELESNELESNKLEY